MEIIIKTQGKTCSISREVVMSPKNKDTKKKNVKHAYTEQQIHSPNFTLVRANGHLNSIHKPTKKQPFSS
jgi:hypothetical protein